MDLGTQNLHFDAAIMSKASERYESVHRVPIQAELKVSAGYEDRECGDVPSYKTKAANGPIGFQGAISYWWKTKIERQHYVITRRILENGDVIDGDPEPCGPPEVIYGARFLGPEFSEI